MVAMGRICQWLSSIVVPAQRSTAVMCSNAHTQAAGSSLERAAALIESGRASNIVVMCGAGVSVSAGIPDFRTPGTGLYDNLVDYGLPYPEAIFDSDYFPTNPAPFYRLCKDLWPGNYSPTPAHRFLARLHAHGKLRRCYTQNIDSLESAAGLPPDLVVAAHGNFDSAHVAGQVATLSSHTQ